jgi:hypothetical protein
MTPRTASSLLGTARPLTGRSACSCRSRRRL